MTSVIYHLAVYDFNTFNHKYIDITPDVIKSYVENNLIKISHLIKSYQCVNKHIDNISYLIRYNKPINICLFTTDGETEVYTEMDNYPFHHHLPLTQDEKDIVHMLEFARESTSDLI